jgi:D-alanyl-D-alanine carboxypeptidase/D-alanyl-D-alanine-endopeptidase (penicillin-binding protein 4)
VLFVATNQTAAQAPALDSLRAQVRAKVDSIVGDSVLRNAQWGALVLDAARGDTLYAVNAGRLFVPGSNQKLVTAAVALAVLGPDFRFTTRLASSGEVNDGTLSGDLVVLGTGDPSFSDRMRDGDAMAPLRDLADSLRARGILRIDGALRRGTPVFTDAPIGFGWAWDDIGTGYGATVGDLMFNEAFAPASVIIDGVRDTMPPRRPRYENFLGALYAALRERGITVRAGFDWSTTVPDSGLGTLVTFSSPPLREILPHFQKESLNQIGEILLKTIGLRVTGAGRADSGATVVAKHLLAWGADSSDFVVRDGSGLSRHNWASPRTMARVLMVMQRDTTWSVFRSALPIAGIDGTLERRMRGTPAAGNARAKTGSMDRVRAISGYISSGGRELVFSLMANGYTVQGRDVEALFDAIIEYLSSLPVPR